MTLLATLAGLVLFVPGSLRARSADVSGAWTFVCETPQGPRTVKASLTVDGDKVTGTWDGAAVQGTTTEGRLDLAFDYTPVELGTKGTLTIKGQPEGEALTGTWTFDTYSGSFKATRTPPIDVSGTWKVTGDVVGNAVDLTCTLKQDAAVVSGSCKLPDTDAAVTGESDGQTVRFQFPVQYQGQELTMVFKGQSADGGGLKGGIEVAGVTGAFTAHKQ